MTLRSPTGSPGRSNGSPGRSTGFTTFLARILFLLLAASCHATIQDEGGFVLHMLENLILVGEVYHTL